MDSQTKVFRAHRALAWFYAIAGIGVGAAIGLTVQKGFEAGAFSAFVALGCFFALHFVTARACRAGKPWGRRVSQVIGVLFLAGFPMGTIIGIYLLTHTWKPWPESVPA